MTFRHNLVPCLLGKALSPRQGELQGIEGVSPIGSPPSGPWAWTATADRSDICHALLHVVTDAGLRWRRAEDIEACVASRRRATGTLCSHCLSASSPESTHSWLLVGTGMLWFVTSRQPSRWCIRRLSLTSSRPLSTSFCSAPVPHGECSSLSCPCAGPHVGVCPTGQLLELVQQ